MIIDNKFRFGDYITDGDVAFKVEQITIDLYDNIYYTGSDNYILEDDIINRNGSIIGLLKGAIECGYKYIGREDGYTIVCAKHSLNRIYGGSFEASSCSLNLENGIEDEPIFDCLVDTADMIEIEDLIKYYKENRTDIKVKFV